MKIKRTLHYHLQEQQILEGSKMCSEVSCTKPFSSKTASSSQSTKLCGSLRNQSKRNGRKKMKRCVSLWVVLKLLVCVSYVE